MSISRSGGKVRPGGAVGAYVTLSGIGGSLVGIAYLTGFQGDGIVVSRSGEPYRHGEFRSSRKWYLFAQGNGVVSRSGDGTSLRIDEIARGGISGDPGAYLELVGGARGDHVEAYCLQSFSRSGSAGGVREAPAGSGGEDVGEICGGRAVSVGVDPTQGVVLVHVVVGACGSTYEGDVALDARIVIGNVEVALISPSGAPGIFHDPGSGAGRALVGVEIGNVVIVVPSHRGDAVIRTGSAGVIIGCGGGVPFDAADVSRHIVRGIHADGHSAVMHDGVFQILGAHGRIPLDEGGKIVGVGQNALVCLASRRVGSVVGSGALSHGSCPTCQQGHRFPV